MAKQEKKLPFELNLEKIFKADMIKLYKKSFYAKTKRAADKPQQPEIK